MAVFPVGMSWQITLIEPPSLAETSLGVGAWDLDLFDTDASIITALQAEGTQVICYFSAGTFEPGRPDEADFPARVIGNGYEDDNFAEERYLDVNDVVVLDIMRARLDLAVAKGCDAVDPDNVDLMDHDSGFAITAPEMAAFNLALVDEAHDRGLAIGLKNDLDQFDDIAAAYDFAVNEECVQFDECGVYSDSFIAAGKAVFHIEYVPVREAAAVCAITQPLSLSTLIKNLILDDPFTLCP